MILYLKVKIQLSQRAYNGLVQVSWTFSYSNWKQSLEYITHSRYIWNPTKPQNDKDSPTDAKECPAINTSEGPAPSSPDGRLRPENADTPQLSVFDP